MAWRFNPSKYKNTTPKAPKKEETLYDVPVGTLLTGNNGIQCSYTHMAFGLEGEGGKVGVLPIDVRGRRQRTEMKIFCAHADPLNDFTFLPFDPLLLATCSRDEKLKFWRCEESEEFGSVSDPDAVIDLGAGRIIDCLAPHRTAAQILGVATNNAISIIDIDRGISAIELESPFEERVDSMSWSPDGKLLAVIGDKGRHGALFDPRSDKPKIDGFELHEGIGRESRIVFTGNNKIVSSGFTPNRVQEVRLLDINNITCPVYVQEYSSSTGVLLPLYDDDTKLLFLVGKGTNKLIISELQDKAPQISPVYEFVTKDQTIGASLGSKFTADVMSGEVVRLFQLSKNSIAPIPCIVPRRTYRDFHKDLFPDAIGPVAGCSAADWFAGLNTQPPLFSLDPAKKQAFTTFGTIADTNRDGAPRSRKSSDASATMSASSDGPDMDIVNSPSVSVPLSHLAEAEVVIKGSVAEARSAFEEKENKQKEVPAAAATKAEARPVAVRRRSPNDVTNRADKSKAASIVGVVSKYRHVETIPGGQHGTFFNVRNVNTRLPTDSNGFCVSSKYGAVPLAGPAGIISVIDLSNITKLPDGVVDGLQNRLPLTDLTWNPFNPNQLACALESGELNIWTIKNLEEPLADLEPSDIIRVSNDKLISIRYNPVASDIIAASSHDQSLAVWNLETRECVWQWVPHDDGTILSFAWSSDGRRIATVGRDLHVCVLQPLREDPLLARECIIESPRAARILFACDDSLLILTHFSKASSRQISLLDANTLQVIYTTSLDTSSQPLIPHYDSDSSVLFLTGKGDRQITMFEVSSASPYLLPLSLGAFPQGHQAIALHQKIDCDVRAVEFQKGWRLTEKTIEKLSFRVPRVKKDLFQSDVFPDALVTWQPAMNASEWCSGCDRQPFMLNLCPEGMAQSIPPAALARQTKKTPAPAERQKATGTVKDLNPQEERKMVEMQWSHRIDVDHALEQDRMDGVEEEEWRDVSEE